MGVGGLGRVLKACTEQICKSLVANEALLNELDRGSGDGDCGSTLKSGAQGESHIQQHNGGVVIPCLSCFRYTVIFPLG